jgi:MFS family permease
MDDQPSQPQGRGRLRMAVRALAHRNFRLFFVGQSVSVLGTWMQQIAMSWLVYQLTNSPLMLGIVAFISTAPLFVLTPFAGVWADRWDRRRTLLVTQGLLTLQALVLGVLTLTGEIAVWQIIVLGAFAGCIEAVASATLTAFVAEMVEAKADLGSAIGLNSMIQTGARMLGPPLAGGLIALLATGDGVARGTGVCFVVNGVSYLAVCAALWAMRVAPAVPRAGHRSMWRQLQEGVAYAFRQPSIRDLLLVQALVGLLGAPYTLMPVVARELLDGGPATLGLLMGFGALGALLGGVFLAVQPGVQGALGRIAVAGLVLGSALIGFSFSRELWLSLGLRIVIGVTMMLATASGFTLVQTVVADDKRGRVMSLCLVAVLGFSALGNLLAGSLADWIGVAATFLASGAGCLIGFLWFAARVPALQPFVEVRSSEMEATAVPPAHGVAEAHQES